MAPDQHGVRQKDLPSRMPLTKYLDQLRNLDGKLPIDVSGPFPAVSDFLSRMLDLQLWLKLYLRSDVWTFRGYDDR